MTKLEHLKKQKLAIENKIRKEEIATISTKAQDAIRKEVADRIKQVVENISFDEVCSGEEFEILSEQEKKTIVKHALASEKDCVEQVVPVFSTRLFWI